MNKIASALEEMRKRGYTIPKTTKLLSPSDPEKAEIEPFVDGLEVVYCPTAARFALARCQWSLAREFENFLYERERECAPFQ